VKVAKGDIYSPANGIPELKFGDQQLTSFAALVVFQQLFRSCRLKERLEEGRAHLLGRHYYMYTSRIPTHLAQIGALDPSRNHTVAAGLTSIPGTC